MKNLVDSDLSANLSSNAGSGLSRYRVSVKFIDKSGITTQLSVLTHKEVGNLSIGSERSYLYSRF